MSDKCSHAFPRLDRFTTVSIYAVFGVSGGFRQRKRYAYPEFVGSLRRSY